MIREYIKEIIRKKNKTRLEKLQEEVNSNIKCLSENSFLK